MGREIKIKAWDKREKKMFIPDGLKNPVNFTDNVDHMQFTGLLDKKGVEIYEGDIMKGFYYSGEEETGVVKFHEGQWILKIGKNTCYGLYPILKTRDIVAVIGNIRENPDLI